MARRPMRQPRGAPPPEEYGEFYDDRPPPSYFRRKRSSGNTGLYVALGLAVLVGLVFLLFVTGGESDEEVGTKALASLQEFMEICVDGRDKEGPDRLVAWEVLRDELTKKQVKEYHTMPEDRRRDLERQAYQTLKYRIVPFRDERGNLVPGVDLKIIDRSEIATMLAGADLLVSDAGKKVDIEWLRNGRMWLAQLQLQSSGWKILRLNEKQ